MGKRNSGTIGETMKEKNRYRDGGENKKLARLLEEQYGSRNEALRERELRVSVSKRDERAVGGGGGGAQLAKNSRFSRTARLGDVFCAASEFVRCAVVRSLRSSHFSSGCQRQKSMLPRYLRVPMAG